MIWKLAQLKRSLKQISVSEGCIIAIQGENKIKLLFDIEATFQW